MKLWDLQIDHLDWGPRAPGCNRGKYRFSLGLPSLKKANNPGVDEVTGILGPGE